MLRKEVKIHALRNHAKKTTTQKAEEKTRPETSEENILLLPTIPESPPQKPRSRKKKVIYLHPFSSHHMFNRQPIHYYPAIDFLKNIMEGKKDLIVSLLKSDPSLAYASVDATQLFGVETRLERVTAHQCAFLMSHNDLEPRSLKDDRLTISMNLYKHLGDEAAYSQIGALGDIKDILEKINEKEFPKLSR